MGMRRGFRRTSIVTVALLACGFGGSTGSTSSNTASAAELQFKRGDSNSSGAVDISDGIATLQFLFAGGTVIECLDAADSDDNGTLELTDGVYTFLFLFAGGAPIPEPGHMVCGPDPTPDALTCDVSPCDQPPINGELREVGHVLSRLSYGVTPDELARVQSMGVDAYIQEQLNPEAIDESGNTELNSRIDPLFRDKQPARDSTLLARHTVAHWVKGTSQPPAGWDEPEFDDSNWDLNPTSIGYGDGDDLTLLPDMRRISDNPETPDVDESQPGYATVYLRKSFMVADPSSVDQLVASVLYDDSYALYLNGSMIQRIGLPAGNLLYTTLASRSHEAEEYEEFDLSARRNLLVPGENVIAVEVHNTSYTSSDLSFDIELVSREILPGPSIRVIRGIDELQQLVHVRGIYSKRQLQAVLGEFWENHFTSDYDKVAEYFDNLQNSDATDAMTASQAAEEAAQLDFQEYDFFLENALGNFGDMLLYSAASPAMNVYLDNILNIKSAPNENYPREILELYAFGVDNRYSQIDIEKLAEAFTGWTVCKVALDEVKNFPESAFDPVTDCGVLFEDTVFMNLGPGWTYFKGTEEPSPVGAEATTLWTQPEFDDSAWLAGSTSIGYGDGDDQTVLNDMRNNYYSVYLRREFTVVDPLDFKNLILQVDYDDGFVAYLNGQEVARSLTMEEEGRPPTFDQDADDTHEVDEGTEYFNLNSFLALLRPAPEVNVLAIQVHNASLGSSDLSILPLLIDREILPGSMENGDPNGAWVFRFDPSEHDTSAKTIFQGSPYSVSLPAGRTGITGIRDALDVVEEMVSHPSTSEFICIKLIQKFVSDGITLQNFKAGDAPIELRELLSEMIGAWNSTSPPGNIRTVMTALLDRDSLFWEDSSFRSKVKTPVEFLNSSIRVLEGAASGEGLPQLNEDLGMHLFTRDEPDGWSELGFDWISTATMLDRMKFAVELSENLDSDYRWNALTYADKHGLATAEDLVDFVSEVFYQDTLPASNKNLLLEFLTTDKNGNPLALNRANASDFRNRVEEFFGLVLSMPNWNFQ